MATLLLTAAAGAASTALGLGTLGQAALGLGAAVGGRLIDQARFGPRPQHQVREGPRLATVNITASTEGAAILRLWGRSRLSGQIIWATRLEEEVVKETQKVGGKGGRRSTVTTEEFHYFANFAVGLCEGPVARIGRIWADGREMDQSLLSGKGGVGLMRAYLGDEEQEPDSLIEAKEGAGNAPAYRGLAYLVFERLHLEDYGNRIPQITAEVFRPVGELEGLVRGVCVIPGTTEFGYDPVRVQRDLAPGEAAPENRRTMQADTDFAASLDMLEALAPDCGTALLVVAWFGDDLRCGTCTIRPKVERDDRETSPVSWQVAGLTRDTALVVSQIGGTPAFGGSPNDASVIRAVQALKDRGLAVILYPFIMMDVPAGNTLPNPYSDNASATGQPVYPWRGRITISPAPGFDGSPDKTGDAATQVAAFVGDAEASDFASSSGTEVVFTGTAQFSYSRFVLHMAKLADLAGGVTAFCLGSEMVGMTRSRSGATTYPFVAALKDLAGEVRTMLGGGAKISYAADWSEYHSHRPDDESGDVIFNLDPLWADENVDFVAIDNYLPLADWRDGVSHLDYDPAGPTAIYDRAYLQSNVEGGEHYDFFYASEADRAAQTRTPIADSAHGEPFVFRNKDIKGWWLNAHHDRPGGERDEDPTDWVPQGKPVWFVELGVPAVDKGANQPNVFFDPKSSESFFPHFSSGARDDAMQRAALEATLLYWADAANNPVSAVYDAPMIDTSKTCVWAWDARMVPGFPDDDKTWADAENWDRGHWISGRLGAAPARETVEAIFAEYGFADGAVEPVGSVVDALMADRVLSARQLLEAAALVHGFDAVESEGLIRIRDRTGRGAVATIEIDDLVAAANGEPADRYLLTRAQETELPQVVKLVYGEPTSDDRPGAVEARRGTVRSLRTVEHQVPVIMAEAKARMAAELLLHDSWVGRERLSLALPPSRLALDPGDVVHFAPTAEAFRLVEIADGEARRCEAVRVEPGLFGPSPAPRRSRVAAEPPALARPVAIFMDGPLLLDHHADHSGYVAAHARPWPGGVALHRSPTDAGFVLDQVLTMPAILGETAFDFFSGPAWRFDRGNELWVDVLAGTLASAEEIAVFAGANALAVENADGEWEVVQFKDAELMAPRRYKLTTLLRGQRGSEHAMRDPVAAGARVLILDEAVRQTAIGEAQVGLPLNWRIGPAGRDIDDDAFADKTVTLHGKARRPLSPVHARAARDHVTGDLLIRWTRRTRIGGDNWEPPDVPLGEEAERYELEILDPDDDSVVRTVVGLTVPSYLYEAAEQVADFDFTISVARIAVYQRSQTFGRGMPLLAWAES